MKRAPVLLAMLFAVAGVLAVQAGAADTAPAATERLQTLEQGILSRLNATRAAHGLRPLTLSDDLQSAAVAHSRSMLQDGFFEHDSRDGSPFFVRVKRFYRAAGYDGWSVGENLLYNTAEMDAATAMEAWLDSPAHRENMLAPGWRDVGIGALHASTAGGTFGGEPTWVITMDFGSRSGSKPEKPATAKVAKVSPKKIKHARAKQTARPHAKPAEPLKPTKPTKQKVERVLPLPADDDENEPAPAGAPDDTVAPAVPVDVAAEQDADDDPDLPDRHHSGDDDPGEDGDAGGAAEPPPEP